MILTAPHLKSASAVVLSQVQNLICTLHLSILLRSVASGSNKIKPPFIATLSFTNMDQALSIRADYFFYGIEIGILDFNDAISWADSVIKDSAKPSSEIIDLALSRPRGRNGVMEALAEIPGERNPEVAGRLLLAELSRRMSSVKELKVISRQALDVAWATQQPEEIRFELDRIDDGIYLAESGTYGTINECRQELEDALSAYGGINET